MIEEADLVRIATELRNRLEPLWKEWHQEQAAIAERVGRACDGGRPPSWKMCGFTVFATKDVLSEATGLDLRVAGGSEWLGDIGGMRDLAGTWQSHWWLTDGRTIVDLTADQFGHDPVVVCERKDPRYRANYSTREIRQHATRVAATAGRWKAILRSDLSPDVPERATFHGMA